MFLAPLLAFALWLTALLLVVLDPTAMPVLLVCSALVPFTFVLALLD